MAKRYDATIKTLVDARPVDWLVYARLPIGGEIKVVDADVSSITSATDKVIRVETPRPYIAHFEFQSGLDVELDHRVLLYNVLLRHRHRIPVRSVVLLLRPKALTAEITASVSENEDVDSKLEFRYRLIRVWELPVEAVLAGGIGTLPLAPISDLGTATVESVFREIKHRLEPPVPSQVAADTLTAAAILTGLRFPKEVGRLLLKGVRHMEDSTVYQSIIEEGVERGEVKEAKSILQRFGTRRLGPPSAEILKELLALSDIQRIEFLLDRLDEVRNWQDLFAE